MPSKAIKKLIMPKQFATRYINRFLKFDWLELWWLIAGPWAYFVMLPVAYVYYTLFSSRILRKEEERKLHSEERIKQMYRGVTDAQS